MKTFLQLSKNNLAEMEINTIIKLILFGIGLFILIYIITSIFTDKVSGGFDSFFDLLSF